MTEKLKREFIELLERDREFRYTVAGYLGLDEILKKLDRLAEGQTKLWEEVSGLREEQTKLWENQNRLWEEIRELRLEQGKMRRYMVSGFRSLSRALGVTFEDYSASFLEVMLGEMGYSEARVERKYLVYQGEVVELNLFCEEPLVVGEATVNIGSVEEAEREVEKLVSRVRIVEERYGRSPLMTILSVARSTAQASEALRSLTEKHKIKLIMGREIEESLST
ncbi:hypothetical protein CW706_02405 [Candidatus Bathyarchaeota archaeon]|nr:MAG: hypothetical protein CW706_02405 [Candidatus Bathyarchaeota archaeon]